jgi:hypothetical protein
MSIDQIAEVLDISRNNVEVRLTRARQRLKEMLTDHSGDSSQESEDRSRVCDLHAVKNKPQS